MVQQCEPSSGTPDTSVFGRLLPFRLLGVGLWIVWQWGMRSFPTLMVDPGVLMGRDWGLCDIVMRVGDVATLAIFAMLARRLGSVAAHRRLLVVALLAAVAGSGLLLLWVNEFISWIGWVWIGGLAAAFGGAVLFLYWADVYCRLETGDVFLYGSLSLLLAGAVAFVVYHLSSPLPVLCTLLAPAVSYGLCALSSALLRPRAVEGAVRPVARYPFPWKPVAILALAGFAAGFSNFALFGQTSNTRVGATFVVGLAIALSFVLFRDRTRPVVFAKGALALITMGLVAVALMGPEHRDIAAWLIMLSYVGINVFVLGLMVNLSVGYGIAALWLFGWGRAASELMMGLGSYAGSWIPSVKLVPESPFALAILAVVGLVAVGALVIMWMSERSFTSGWAVEPIVALPGEVRSPLEARRERCREVARGCDLTDREAQIMQMLLEGDSYQRVCQSLLVSLGTVKTHVYHIYGKLGVHSREEMAALVDGADSAEE